MYEANYHISSTTVTSADTPDDEFKFLDSYHAFRQ